MNNISIFVLMKWSDILLGLSSVITHSAVATPEKVAPSASVMRWLWNDHEDCETKQGNGVTVGPDQDAYTPAVNLWELEKLHLFNKGK